MVARLFLSCSIIFLNAFFIHLIVHFISLLFFFAPRYIKIYTYMVIIIFMIKLASV